MPPAKTVIFIPTYNECENAPELYKQIRALGLDTDILFLDDNSPDGTGRILDDLATRDPRLMVIHRTGKLGIGSATRRRHQLGLRPRLRAAGDDGLRFHAHAVGHPAAAGTGRQVRRGRRLPLAEVRQSAGLNALRRFLTNFGHFLTRVLLGMPYDATGAFRLYNLQRVPRNLFAAVKSRKLCVLFESLFLLTFNGYSIHEVPIILPSRMYGHSKMDWRRGRTEPHCALADVLRQNLPPETVPYRSTLSTAMRAKLNTEKLRSADESDAGSTRWSMRRRLPRRQIVSSFGRNIQQPRCWLRLARCCVFASGSAPAGYGAMRSIASTWFPGRSRVSGRTCNTTPSRCFGSWY